MSVFGSLSAATLFDVSDSAPSMVLYTIPIPRGHHLSRLPNLPNDFVKEASMKPARNGRCLLHLNTSMSFLRITLGFPNPIVPDGIEYETINVDPGKTYWIRVHNAGTSTSLNFRIQNHNLLLVETEGCYKSQSNYTQFDIHVEQSYSFLVSMDQNASTDYYIVASARFVNKSLWQRVTGVAVLHYSNSKGPATGPLPDPPNDFYDKEASMNQARSISPFRLDDFINLFTASSKVPLLIRKNPSGSGARPNPQGSFRYGSINITDTYMLKVLPPTLINGHVRAAINGISFVKPEIPFRLAEQRKLRAVYKLDFPSKPLNRPPVMDRSLINAPYEGFIEIILHNNDTTIQIFHMDGYSFFVVE
ncbi:hypothetical protein K1719_036477 [Acacia pycnantha]|nr:hypothetical protein K1719_036477 [Acacia pycnantha]